MAADETLRTTGEPQERLDMTLLRAELRRRNARRVAIDGPGGAGKSTLARQLVTGWPNAVVVETDDFHRPGAERDPSSEAHGSSVDRERLVAQLLEPLAAGRAGRYRRYDWDEARLAEWHEVPAEAVLVLEGVYAACEPLRRYFDYTIWIDCPYELRLRRGVERDGQAMRAVWVDEWMPAEEHYLQGERPDLRSDLVLDGSGMGGDGVVFAVRRAHRPYGILT